MKKIILALLITMNVQAAVVDDYVKQRPLKRTFFGCKLGDSACTNASAPSVCNISKPSTGWPDNKSSKTLLPLAFTAWRGPYLNKAGYDNVKLINKSYTDKLSIGLTKEKFKSFDALISVSATKVATYKAHSLIEPKAFPHLEILDPAVYFDRTCYIEYDIYQKKHVNRCSIEQPLGKEVCKSVYEPRVNYVVRSLGTPSTEYGSNLLNIGDYHEKNKLRAAYYKSLIDPVVTPPVFSDTLLKNTLNKGETQSYFREFYENNVLFVSPAIRSHTYGDYFSTLSPFTLQSIGASGTDSVLINPIIRASSVIPSELKKRILNTQALVPTLMYLFKSSIQSDYNLSQTHYPAYILPNESGDVKLANNAAYEAAAKMEAPFLDKLMKEASELTHIPPIARIKVLDVKISAPVKRKYYMAPYYRDETYSFHGALRDEENLELVIDLYDSWVDQGKDIVSYSAVNLRGPGIITKLKEDGSILKIEIPYTKFTSKYNSRSDILLYVNDGKYNSAPAYISIKHIQPIEELYYFK